MQTRLFSKLFCFLALLAYVNTLFYEDGHAHGDNSGQIIDGAPLVEIILEDVLDIPHSDESGSPDNVQYDDYRPSSSKWLSVAPSKKGIEFGSLWATNIPLYTSGLTLNTKVTHLLGYYVFLFRFKPF